VRTVTEDLWLTVQSSIVIRVPTVQVPHRAVYIRARECRDIWEVRVTVQNLEVVKVDPEKNLILVKGAVPGSKKSTYHNQRNNNSRGIERDGKEERTDGKRICL
jgi:hypothetical protein